MTSTLFPENGSLISIQQGKSDDCYLLASLDCLFHAGPEGLASIKSLFVETECGVSVHIKRSLISAHLKLAQLMKKYGYYYDAVNEADVFIIDKSRLEEIDSDPDGAQSNSLAVKILEHISAYYFEVNWEEFPRVNSMAAHSIAGRTTDSDAQFMGQLFGIATIDNYDIDTVIQLKALDPSYPMWIGIAHAGGRHALAIDEIRPSQTEGYDFILRNPHDNTQRECYTLNEIKSRRYYFCLFKLDSEKAALTHLLLSLPLQDGLVIMRTPIIAQWIIDLQKLKPNFSARDLKHCYTLYQEIPLIISIFNDLPVNEKLLFISTINHIQNGKEIFLSRLFISAYSSHELNTFIFRAHILNTVKENVASFEWLTIGITLFLTKSIWVPGFKELLVDESKNLTPSQLDTILNNIPIYGARNLFLALHHLSKVNTELATRFVHRAIQQFRCKFHFISLSFRALAQGISQEEPSEFQQWFAQATTLKDLCEALESHPACSIAMLN